MTPEVDTPSLITHEPIMRIDLWIIETSSTRSNERKRNAHIVCLWPSFHVTKPNL